LEAATVDQAASVRWHCFAKDVTGVVNLAVSEALDPNSRAVNTPLIAVKCPGPATNAAVYIWPNGQTDGFLPIKEELDLLYDKKVAGVVSGFTDSTIGVRRRSAVTLLGSRSSSMAVSSSPIRTTHVVFVRFGLFNYFFPAAGGAIFSPTYVELRQR
jgi:hypothetical protein